MNLGLPGFGRLPDDVEVRWPPIGDTVNLSLPCCPRGLHPCKVIERSPNLMVITAPKKPHETYVDFPADNEKIVISWRDGVDGATLPARFVWNGTKPEPVWAVRAVGQIDYLRRRTTARLQWSSDAEISLPGLAQPISGRIYDVSGGGARIELPDGIDRPLDEAQLQVTFKSTNGVSSFKAEVAWWGPPDKGMRFVGLRFVEEPSPDL